MIQHNTDDLRGMVLYLFWNTYEFLKNCVTKEALEPSDSVITTLQDVLATDETLLVTATLPISLLVRRGRPSLELNNVLSQSR